MTSTSQTTDESRAGVAVASAVVTGPLIGTVLDQSEREHGSADLEAPGDVRPGEVVPRDRVLLGGCGAPVVDRPHGLCETGFRVLERPRVPAGVLLHLQG